MQGLCNGRVSVRLSVPLIDVCHLPQLGRRQQISIDQQLPATRTGYRSTAAGARAAAAGSVMLRAEVRGSQHRPFKRKHDNLY